VNAYRRSLRAQVAARLGRFGQTARTVVVSMWNDDALLDASAMAFSLFLASIPLLALTGSVAADTLRGDSRALTVLSHRIDLAPAEVRTLVDRHLARGSGRSVAPLFLLGALWLGANAVVVTLALVAAFFRIAVRHRNRHPRTWPGAISCVVIGILASAAFANYARLLAGYALFY
jgi:uncharacterized BrkB/YihY/UPF0761 family membrane protein